MNPQGLSCKNECLGGAYLREGLIQGGLFQALAFSSKVDIRSDNFLHEVTKKIAHTKFISQ